MEIIARTKDGCLLQASKREVNEILRAVSGEEKKELFIGQKIPAIDYASTITRIRTLGNDSDYKIMLRKVEEFSTKVNNLKEAIQKASLIEL